MKDIYFTSFKKSSLLPNFVTPLSCAVYQPTGFNYPKVDWTDIRDSSGNWTRPRNFIEAPNPTLAYENRLLALYRSRAYDAKTWLDGLEGPVALCCWCPFDRAAQRQLKEFGSFICHTYVLSKFLHEDLGATTWLDSDRLKLTTLTQNWSNS